VANVVGGWGHPEDCVAVAFVVWSALTMDRYGAAGASRAALLLGLGIAFQPLAILGVVPVLARLLWRRAARLWWRLALPSVVVLAPALLAETHQTLFVLVHQPFTPQDVSFTPLTRLAPVLAPGVHGGGPMRLVAIVVSAALALLVCRRRHDLPTVLTVVAAGFFLRVALETEMNWYYVWPVPALCLVLSLRRGRVRFGLCAAAMVASGVLADHRVHHIAWWWPALMATTALMLLCIGPTPRRWLELAAGRRRHEEPARPVEFVAMVSAANAGQPRE
jgi:hypothetical protein